MNSVAIDKPGSGSIDHHRTSISRKRFYPPAPVKPLLILLGIGMLSACGSSGEIPGEVCTSGVCYRVSFNETWNAANFPTQYPSDSHFSPLVGAVHGPGIDFFELNQSASAGMESMAETGRTGILLTEIDASIVGGDALQAIRGPGIPNAETIAVTEFAVSDAYPLVTLVSMVAPSPDWFVGVDSLNLRDSSGNFIDALIVDLVVYDAGSDSGATFASPNSNSNGVITRLSCADLVADCGFSVGLGTDGVQFIGSFVFEKL